MSLQITFVRNSVCLKKIKYPYQQRKINLHNESDNINIHYTVGNQHYFKRQHI